MHFDFRIDESGYIVTITGEYDASALLTVWERIQAERTASGFDFGVFDLTAIEIAALRGWDLSGDAVERLHPIARMINANLTPGFRLAIVSSQDEMEQAIDDLLSVAEFGTGSSPRGGAPDVTRHRTLDEALIWCRAGVADQAGTTVRE